MALPVRAPVAAYIGLGANLGDARLTLCRALEKLRTLDFDGGWQVSGLYASAPIDSSGPDYLNAVATLRTTLTAPLLLQQLQAIENAAGRERPYRNAPRTLDLDLLFYGDARIDSPTLTVPHPRIFQRAFVLLPLAEIAPERVSQMQMEGVSDQRIVRLGSFHGAAAI